MCSTGRIHRVAANKGAEILKKSSRSALLCGPQTNSCSPQTSVSLRPAENALRPADESAAEKKSTKSAGPPTLLLPLTHPSRLPPTPNPSTTPLTPSLHLPPLHKTLTTRSATRPFPTSRRDPIRSHTSRRDPFRERNQHSPHRELPTHALLLLLRCWHSPHAPLPQPQPNPPQPPGPPPPPPLQPSSKRLAFSNLFIMPKVAAVKRKRPVTQQEKLAELIRTLQFRPMVTTHTLDFDFLDEIGLLGEFIRLTNRLGLSRDFWEIPARSPTYQTLTAEFLATLALHTLADNSHEITFRMLNQNHRVSLSTLTEVFHLSQPETDHLDYVHADYEFSENESKKPVALRAAFWLQISGEQLPPSRADPRVNAIVHPLLRAICRYMSHSIFARGESTLRPRHEELALLATMLLPADTFQQPNIALLMVHNWLSLVHPTRDNTVIAIGANVTHLARHVGVDFSDPQGEIGSSASGYEKPFPNARSLNRDQYRLWKWLVLKPASPPEPPRWVWPLNNNDSLDLPLKFPPISFESPSTWLMHALPQSPPPPSPQDGFAWIPDPPTPPPDSAPLSPWSAAAADRSAGGGYFSAGGDAGCSAGGGGWPAGGDGAWSAGGDAGWPAGGDGAWSAGGAGWSAGGAGMSAGGAGTTQMHEWMQQTHGWMHDVHGWMKEMHDWMKDTNSSVESLSSTTQQIKDRQDEMFHLIRAMHAAQLGEGASGPPDDTTTH